MYVMACWSSQLSPLPPPHSRLLFAYYILQGILHNTYIGIGIDIGIDFFGPKWHSRPSNQPPPPPSSIPPHIQLIGRNNKQQHTRTPNNRQQHTTTVDNSTLVDKNTNVPLFKKLFGYNFFWGGESLYEPFLGTFWGGLDFFDPLNCPDSWTMQFNLWHLEIAVVWGGGVLLGYSAYIIFL